MPFIITAEKLESLIDECGTLKKGDYTDESWIPFAKALEEAKAVSAKQDASQEEIDNAYKALAQARTALKENTNTETPELKELRNLIGECETLKKRSIQMKAGIHLQRY